MGFIPVCPGCVITWDGPGRLDNLAGDDERRKCGEEVDKWFWECKTSKAAKMLLMQTQKKRVRAANSKYQNI